MIVLIVVNSLFADIHRSSPRSRGHSSALANRAVLFPRSEPQ